MEKRSRWNSFFGLTMVCVGSAIGLGNLWKFPYITFHNGGGAFVLVYLISVAAICLPIFMAEMFLGKHSQANVYTTIKEVTNDHFFGRIVGALCLFTAFAVLSFYSVVAGWTLEYIAQSLTGHVVTMTPESAEPHFISFLGNGPRQVLLQSLFLLLTGAIVIYGTKGIEKTSRVLMPALFVIMIVITFFSANRYGLSDSFAFLFRFDLSTLTRKSVLEAMGHAFFTLSTGLGVILVYGSYVPRKFNLVKASIAIALLDTINGLMACLMIYPIIFHTDMKVQESSSILFTSLTLQLNQFPYPRVVCALFYMLLAFAALSSTISMLEVTVSFVSERYKLKRVKATIYSLAGIWLVGITAALSNGASEFFSALGIMNLLDKAVTNWTMPLGGISLSIICGWFLSKKVHRKEIATQFYNPTLYKGWLLLVKFVAPAAVIIIMISQFGILGD